MADLIIEGPADAHHLLVLAHGAGAPMTSPFLGSVSELLTARGIATARFEFAYMAARREGVRKPPPRAERLVPEYQTVVDRLAVEAAGQRLLIGGKSMGGRVASLAADELYRDGRIAGLVCLGYPFHPPNRPSELRTAHLAELACPTLIVQGERDPFGSRSEVEGYTLSPAIRLIWIGDGDHDLGPRGGSGYTRKGNLETAVDAIAAFAEAS
jgi:predicted alpha/beta-hydrolase family hydrolase